MDTAACGESLDLYGREECLVLKCVVAHQGMIIIRIDDFAINDRSPLKRSGRSLRPEPTSMQSCASRLERVKRVGRSGAEKTCVRAG
jgi:hypothetical protein